MQTGGKMGLALVMKGVLDRSQRQCKPEVVDSVVGIADTPRTPEAAVKRDCKVRNVQFQIWAAGMRRGYSVAAKTDGFVVVGYGAKPLESSLQSVCKSGHVPRAPGASI